MRHETNCPYPMLAAAISLLLCVNSQLALAAFPKNSTNGTDSNGDVPANASGQKSMKKTASMTANVISNGELSQEPRRGETLTVSFPGIWRCYSADGKTMLADADPEDPTDASNGQENDVLNITAVSKDNEPVKTAATYINEGLNIREYVDSNGKLLGTATAPMRSEFMISAAHGASAGKRMNVMFVNDTDTGEKIAFYRSYKIDNSNGKLTVEEVHAPTNGVEVPISNFNVKQISRRVIDQNSNDPVPAGILDGDYGDKENNSEAFDEPSDIQIIDENGNPVDYQENCPDGIYTLNTGVPLDTGVPDDRYLQCKNGPEFAVYKGQAYKFCDDGRSHCLVGNDDCIYAASDYNTTDIHIHVKNGIISSDGSKKEQDAALEYPNIGTASTDMSGNEFILYKRNIDSFDDVTCHILANQSTDKAGELVFHNLGAGTYYIQQIKSSREHGLIPMMGCNEFGWEFTITNKMQLDKNKLLPSTAPFDRSSNRSSISNIEYMLLMLKRNVRVDEKTTNAISMNAPMLNRKVVIHTIDMSDNGNIRGTDPSDSSNTPAGSVWGLYPTEFGSHFADDELTSTLAASGKYRKYAYDMDARMRLSRPYVLATTSAVDGADFGAKGRLIGEMTFEDVPMGKWWAQCITPAPGDAFDKRIIGIIVDDDNSAPNTQIPQWPWKIKNLSPDENISDMKKQEPGDYIPTPFITIPGSLKLIPSDDKIDYEYDPAHDSITVYKYASDIATGTLSPELVSEHPETTGIQMDQAMFEKAYIQSQADSGVDVASLRTSADALWSAFKNPPYSIGDTMSLYNEHYSIGRPAQAIGSPAPHASYIKEDGSIAYDPLRYGITRIDGVSSFSYAGAASDRSDPVLSQAPLSNFMPRDAKSLDGRTGVAQWWYPRAVLAGANGRTISQLTSGWYALTQKVLCTASDPVDLNGDGFPDAFDTDGDGIADAFDTIVDKGDSGRFGVHADGRVFLVREDSTEAELTRLGSGFALRGQKRVIAFDVPNAKGELDGVPDVLADAFDTNGDGVADQFDIDSDGRIDVADANGNGYMNVADENDNGVIEDNEIADGEKWAHDESDERLRVTPDYHYGYGDTKVHVGHVYPWLQTLYGASEGGLTLGYSTVSVARHRLGRNVFFATGTVSGSGSLSPDEQIEYYVRGLSSMSIPDRLALLDSIYAASFTYVKDGRRMELPVLITRDPEALSRIGYHADGRDFSIDPGNPRQVMRVAFANDAFAGDSADRLDADDWRTPLWSDYGYERYGTWYMTTPGAFGGAVDAMTKYMVRMEARQLDCTIASNLNDTQLRPYGEIGSSVEYRALPVTAGDGGEATGEFEPAQNVDITTRSGATGTYELPKAWQSMCVKVRSGRRDVIMRLHRIDADDAESRRNNQTVRDYVLARMLMDAIYGSTGQFSFVMQNEPFPVYTHYDMDDGSVVDNNTLMNTARLHYQMEDDPEPRMGYSIDAEIYGATGGDRSNQFRTMPGDPDANGIYQVPSGEIVPTSLANVLPEVFRKPRFQKGNVKPEAFRQWSGHNTLRYVTSKKLYIPDPIVYEYGANDIIGGMRIYPGREPYADPITGYYASKDSKRGLSLICLDPKSDPYLGGGWTYTSEVRANRGALSRWFYPDWISIETPADRILGRGTYRGILGRSSGTKDKGTKGVSRDGGLSEESLAERGIVRGSDYDYNEGQWNDAVSPQEMSVKVDFVDFVSMYLRNGGVYSSDGNETSADGINIYASYAQHDVDGVQSGN